MSWTDEQIEKAVKEFEDFDPGRATAIDTEDLRAIAEAADAVQRDEARLREAVERARARGWSWNRIAVALGVSRQGARQKFGRDNTN